MRYDTSLHFFEMAKLTNNQTTSYFRFLFLFCLFYLWNILSLLTLRWNMPQPSKCRFTGQDVDDTGIASMGAPSSVDLLKIPKIPNIPGKRRQQ